MRRIDMSKQAKLRLKAEDLREQRELNSIVCSTLTHDLLGGVGECMETALWEARKMQSLEGERRGMTTELSGRESQ